MYVFMIVLSFKIVINKANVFLAIELNKTIGYLYAILLGENRNRRCKSCDL